MSLQTVFFLLLDLLLKGAAVLILATAAAWLLRGASAANRGAVWSSAFLVLLLLPLTLALQPQWSWISPRLAESRELLPPPGAVMSTSPTLPLSATEATPLDALMERLLDWQFALVAAWLAGACLLLIRRAAGTLQLWNLRRRSITPPSRILQLSREAADACQLRHPAAVRLSEDRTMPLTWGTWAPVILLPVESVDWHEDLLCIVLRHEYGHIHRRDARFRLLAQIACAFHWMNPLAWYAARELRLVQEQAADDLVLQAGVDPIAYADELVASVRRFLQPARTFEDALAMAQPSTLETRVNALLDERRDRRPLNRLFLCGSIASTALMLAGSAVAQISDKASPVTPQPAPTTPFPAASNATVPVHKFGEHPIKIDAENVSMVNDVALAEGKATLSYPGVKIAGDTIRYFPATRTAIAEGNVDFTAENRDRITGADAARVAFDYIGITGVDAVVEYNLQTKKFKALGKTKSVLKKMGEPE